MADFWVRVAPILTGGLVAAVLGLLTQLWLFRRNRTANRQDRNDAHLEDAVAKLVTLTANLSHELTRPHPTSGGSGDDPRAQVRSHLSQVVEAWSRYTHVLRQFETQVLVTAGWARRARRVEFSAALLLLRTHAAELRLEQRRRRGVDAVIDLLEFTVELCGKWLIGSDTATEAVVRTWQSSQVVPEE